MASAHYIVGRALETLRTIDAHSVDLVFCSPPFFRVRNYLPAEHPDKAAEVGTEPTPGEYIDHLLDVVVECRRVLAPHGSLVFELGDTYSGSGGGGGDYLAGGLRDGQPAFEGTGKAQRSQKYRVPDEQLRSPRDGQAEGFPLEKSKCCIPELFEIALAYGLNPLTGRRLDRWLVRNYVAWVRTNPPPGSQGDKFKPGHSHLTVACTSKQRYFDPISVLEPLADSPGNRYPRRVTERDRTMKDHGQRTYRGSSPNAQTADEYDPTDAAGRVALDWWNIPTKPYPGAHYAVMAPDVAVRPIKSMTPREVCTICGTPSVRVLEPRHDLDRNAQQRARGAVKGWNDDRMDGGAGGFDAADYETAYWSDCGCCWDSHAEERPEVLDRGYCRDVSHWRRGMVLDPYAGSGTTLVVATGHGRDAIGIDIDDRNAEQASDRLGLFLSVEYSRPPVENLPDIAEHEPHAPLYREGDERWDRPGAVRTTTDRTPRP